jgi:hypothetical protein
MSALSITLTVILVLTGLTWIYVRNVLWGAATVVAGLFLMASFGLLWWWIPIVGVIVLFIGVLIALLITSGAGRTILMGVTLVGLIAALIGGASGFAQTPAAADGGSGNGSSGLSDNARNLIAQSLTVKTTSADAECQTDDYDLVSYKIGALENVPEPRKWSDAISTPIAATDAEAARDELQQSICEDPLLGVSYLTFVATDIREALKASTNVDIVALNPWLEPYTADVSNISKKATEFVPLLDAEESTSTDVDAAMKKNGEWQHEASYVNTLLDRFAVTGIDSRLSVVNYHLAAGGMVVGTLPEVERNDKQEDLPALIFSLTEKDQCDELLSVGANMQDKRPELFEAKVCEEAPTTETPSTPGTPETPDNGGCVENCSTQPGCTENCTHTPPPTGCTENCTPVTPPCVTNCPKPWELSVDPPAGVIPQPNDEFEERPALPASPAPVRPVDEVPSSGSGAGGATAPEPDRTQPPAGTGTTPGGGSGSVNPVPAPGSSAPPVNQTDPGNPFG